MAKRDRAGASDIYAAAEQWRDRCLRRDDSLFTPGQSVWTAAVVQDRHERFVQRPDESKRSFTEKLRDQLAGGPPQTVQLAAEMLYVHFPILSSVSGAGKPQIIEDVLAFAPTPASIPGDLAATPDHGLAAGGNRIQYL